MAIKVKRAYEPPENSDGRRFLVDGLWPRGIGKDELRIEGWLRGVAPSAALRKWFGHDPSRWEEFKRRYWEELDGGREGLDVLKEAAGKGDVTLVFGARDTEHNNAVALREWLERSEGVRSEKYE